MTEDQSAVALIEQVHRHGVIRVDHSAEESVQDLGGGYDVVPDEKHREICLHCPEKECRHGTCYRIRGQKEAKRKEKKK